MNTNKFFGVLISGLMAIMLAGCNLPMPTSKNTNDAKIATAAHQTVQAAISQSTMNSPAPNATPFASPAASPLPSQTPTVTPTITPTYSVPMLTINSNTNCRTGPGQDYDIVFTFLPSAKAEIVGQDPQDNYWIVKLPDGSGNCWVWGQYATTSGSYWVVPTLTAPPTATAAPPEAPTFKTWNYQCTWNGVNNNLNMVLTWTDHSNNESGFHVIRNDQVVADLPAGSTSYTDVYAVDTGVSVTYRVEAYNTTGSASTSTISEACK